jgi:hypothetical protein
MASGHFVHHTSTNEIPMAKVINEAAKLFEGEAKRRNALFVGPVRRIITKDRSLTPEERFHVFRESGYDIGQLKYVCGRVEA